MTSNSYVSFSILRYRELHSLLVTNEILHKDVDPLHTGTARYHLMRHWKAEESIRQNLKALFKFHDANGDLDVDLSG